MRSVRALDSMLFFAALAACLSSCVATSSRRPLSAAELREELAAETLFTSARVEELAALEPRLDGPFVLGIAPPLERSSGSLRKGPFAGDSADSSRAGSDHVQLGTWTADERKLLDRRVAELVAAGVIERGVYLPLSLAQTGDQQTGKRVSLLGPVREAAARVHADAVLVVHRVSGVNVASNVAAFLDLTLLGYFVAPGYTVKARSALEGYVIDTHNEYLYATDQASAEAQSTIPGAFVWQKSQGVVERARRDALAKFASRVAVP